MNGRCKKYRNKVNTKTSKQTILLRNIGEKMTIKLPYTTSYLARVARTKRLPSQESFLSFLYTSVPWQGIYSLLGNFFQSSRLSVLFTAPIHLITFQASFFYLYLLKVLWVFNHITGQNAPISKQIKHSNECKDFSTEHIRSYSPETTILYFLIYCPSTKFSRSNQRILGSINIKYCSIQCILKTLNYPHHSLHCTMSTWRVA